MKLKKFLTKSLLLCSLLMFTATPIFADNVYYTMLSNGYNIQGTGGIKTTYGNGGYTVVFCVNGNYVNLSQGSGSYNGVSINTFLQTISAGNYVKITHRVTNNNSSPMTIRIANHADVQINTNDRAPIYSLDGNRGLLMTDGSYQFMFLGRNSYGVTDVDSYWSGYWTDRTNNLWNSNYGSTTGIDSGMAWSWIDRTIPAHSTVDFSALIGVGVLNDPPTITANIPPQSSYYPNQVVPISGVVNDPDSGDVVFVKFAVDGGTEQTIASGIVPNNSAKSYSTSFTLPSNISAGQHFYEVWAADDKGNMSPPVRVYFTVVHDTTAPTATHSLSTNAWTKDNVTINVTATDDVSGVKRIKLPNGTYVNSANASYTVSSNGTYTFVLEDNKGNVRNYPVTISNIDKTIPNMSHSLSNTNWTNQNVTINVSANDNQSGLSYIKKPDGTIVYATSTSYTVSQNGTYTFYGVDNVGNTKTYSVNVTNIDKTVPTCTKIELKNVTTTSYDVYAYGVTDNLSGISTVKFPTWTSYNGQDDIKWLDGQNLGNGTWKFTVQRSNHNNEWGPYITHVYAYDNAGNGVYIGAPQNVNFDIYNPHMNHSITPTNWTNGNVTINVNAWDNETGLNYIKKPNGEIVYADSTSYVVSSNGTYTFYAVDKNNNVLTYPITISNIDKTKPSVSHSLSPNVWTNQNVTITINSGDNGQSGVDYIIKPDGTKVTGSTTTYVVPENGTYTFKVADKVSNVTTYNVPVNNIDKVAPTGSLTINNGATETNNRNLTLHLTHSDNASGIKSIVITDGTNIKTYTSNIPNPIITDWTITPAAGKKNFTVTITDNAGNVGYAYSSIIYTNLEISDLTLTNIVNPLIFNNNNPYSSKTWVFSPQPMSAGANITFKTTISNPVDLPNVTDTVKYTIKVTGNNYSKALSGNMNLVSGTTYDAKVTLPKDAPKGSKVELLITANRQTAEFSETVYYPSKKDSVTFAHIGNINNNIHEDVKFNEVN